MTAPTAIRTCALHRDFVVTPKDEGLLASFRNLFWPRQETLQAVRGLDLEIQAGEMVGFLGPNGAGKTTTLKMLSGLIPPTSGTIEVAGHQPFHREAAFLNQISLVMGQKQNLWWDLPPAETLAIHREIYGLSAEEFRQRRDELVEMLEIGPCLTIQARKLSLGQRMRCELATALLHRPGILFLDEPTIGLDILMQKRIRTFLLDYHARFGTTVLLTSHYMDDVAALTRRVIVINRGRKVFDGPLTALTARARPERILTVTFQAVPAGFSPENLGRVQEQEGPRFRIIIARERAPEIAAHLYATGAVSDLTLEEPPLEEAMADLFAGDATPGPESSSTPDRA
ncbi:MAG: ATP-binding cassette domain-containing protein [Candidatus Riflebacteria bacterium]|nr:ATP-binding cassette domain-containing protein [Candidatus Riflebacteria bacterium]